MVTARYCDEYTLGAIYLIDSISSISPPPFAFCMVFITGVALAASGLPASSTASALYEKNLPSFPAFPSVITVSYTHLTLPPILLV